MIAKYKKLKILSIFLIFFDNFKENDIHPLLFSIKTR